MAAAVVSCGWGLTYGGFHLFFAGNPHFKLEDIDIDTWSKVAEVQVKAILDKHGVREGQVNLFALDLDELRQALERQLVVDKAFLQRKLPTRLKVEIVEPEPVAQWRKPGGILVDKDGWLLPRLNTEMADTLPVITGAREDTPDRAGVRVEDPLVQASLRLLHLVSINGWKQSLDISMIQLDYSERQLRAYVREGVTFRANAQLVVPPDGIQKALQRAMTIVRQRSRAQQTISFMDVTYRRNVPVRP